MRKRSQKRKQQKELSMSDTATIVLAVIEVVRFIRELISCK